MGKTIELRVYLIHLVAFLLLPSCFSQCKFPSELRGTWLDSHLGVLSFNSTTISGYTIPSDACQNPCPETLECYKNDNTTYVLRSPIFTSGKIPVRLYVCWELSEIMTSKVIYYPAIKAINKYTNDRTLFSDADPLDINVVCDRRKPYPPQSYHVLINNDAPLNSVSNCPSEVLGRYSKSQSNCTVLLNSCEDKRTIVISNTQCSHSPLFSLNGSVSCIHSIIDGNNITYLTVYNQDQVVDDINTFRFTCLALRAVSGKLELSENPSECLENQTSVVAPTIGKTYEFTALELCPITDLKDSPGLTTAQISGISLGILLLLSVLLLLLLLCCCWRQKRRKRKQQIDQEKGKERTRQDSDEVHLIRSKREERDSADTASTDSGLGVGGGVGGEDGVGGDHSVSRGGHSVVSSKDGSGIDHSIGGHGNHSFVSGEDGVSIGHSSGGYGNHNITGKDVVGTDDAIGGEEHVSTGASGKDGVSIVDNDKGRYGLNGAEIHSESAVKNSSQRLLTSTRYGQNRKMVTDNYGRQIMVVDDTGSLVQDDHVIEKIRRDFGDDVLPVHRTSTKIDEHNSKNDDKSIPDRTSITRNRLLSDGTQIEEALAINRSGDQVWNPSKDEDTLSNKIRVAECKRENSCYLFQPKVPLDGNLTSRMKDEKRNKDERPRKTTKGLFGSLAKKLSGNRNQITSQDSDSKQYNDSADSTLQQNDDADSTIQHISVETGENRTPYMKEYYYKKDIEHHLDDEGFFDDAESKKRASDIFNFHDDDPAIHPYYNRPDPIICKSKNDQSGSHSSTTLRLTSPASVSVNSDLNNGEAQNGTHIPLQDNGLTDTINIDVINRIQTPARTHGMAHDPTTELPENMSMSNSSTPYSTNSIPDKTPHSTKSIPSKTSNSTKSIPDKTQSHVIFIEECPDIPPENRGRASTMTSQTLRKPTGLPLINFRERSKSTSSHRSPVSWSRFSYNGFPQKSSVPGSHHGQTSSRLVSEYGSSISNYGGPSSIRLGNSQVPFGPPSEFCGPSANSACSQKFIDEINLGIWPDDDHHNQSFLSNPENINEDDYPKWLSKGKSHRAYIADQNKKLIENPRLFTRVPGPHNTTDLDGLLSPAANGQSKRKITPSSLTDWYLSVTPTSARLRYPVLDRDRLKKLLEELYIDKKYLDRLIDQTDDARDESEKSAHQLSCDGSDYLLEMARYWEQRPPLPQIPPATEIGLKLQRASTTVLPNSDNKHSTLVEYSQTQSEC